MSCLPASNVAPPPSPPKDNGPNYYFAFLFPQGFIPSSCLEIVLIKGQLKRSHIFFDEILQKRRSDKIKSGLIVPLDLIRFEDSVQTVCFAGSQVAQSPCFRTVL